MRMMIPNAVLRSKTDCPRQRVSGRVGMLDQPGRPQRHHELTALQQFNKSRLGRFLCFPLHASDIYHSWTSMLRFDRPRTSRSIQ